MSSPWPNVRADFPVLHQQVNGKPLVYLDNGATSQKPRRVIDALVRYYEHDNSNVHRGLHTLSMRSTDAYEGARARIAKFINAADPAEVLFTRGTTESINIVARSWGHAHLKPGDVVLTTEFEHHSNLVPWQQAAKAAGATLKYVPLLGADGEGGLDLAALDKLLTPQVKLFAFTHISNTLGTINPVAELCRRARAVGAVTVIDAAQSIGHQPLDVREIGCDFLAFSGHKMCGPTGIGVLYGRRALLDKLAPDETGGVARNRALLADVDLFPVGNVGGNQIQAEFRELARQGLRELDPELGNPLAAVALAIAHDARLADARSGRDGPQRRVHEGIRVRNQVLRDAAERLREMPHVGADALEKISRPPPGRRSDIRRRRAAGSFSTWVAAHELAPASACEAPILRRAYRA